VADFFGSRRARLSLIDPFDPSARRRLGEAIGSGSHRRARQSGQARWGKWSRSSCAGCSGGPTRPRLLAFRRPPTSLPVVVALPLRRRQLRALPRSLASATCASYCAKCHSVLLSATPSTPSPQSGFTDNEVWRGPCARRLSPWTGWTVLDAPTTAGMQTLMWTPITQS